jgi:hypothetical protein
MSKPEIEKMLNWILEHAAWPYELTIGGPGWDGKSVRPKGSEWYLSYRCKDGKQNADGCVYASTRNDVIAKAMRLSDAQEKATKLLKQAVA